MNRKLTAQEASRIRLIRLVFRRVLDVFMMLHKYLLRKPNGNLWFHPRFKSLVRHEAAMAKHLDGMQSDIQKMIGEDDD